MKMVIGGAYQGKTDYAKQAYPNLVWSDGASCDLKDIFSCSGIVHFEECGSRIRLGSGGCV